MISGFKYILHVNVQKINTSFTSCIIEFDSSVSIYKNNLGSYSNISIFNNYSGADRGI